MERKAKIFKRLKEHYQYLINNNYEVVCIMLQGSQNYNLDIYTDNYMSDIDSKAIVLPTFQNIINNDEPISTTLILENNEHIDVKDVRVMFDNFIKQNIAYIELLFTDFKIINPKYKNIVQDIFDYNLEIASIDKNKLLKALSGISMNKVKALTHPYPTIKDKIDKYGYDPKQLHHILRVNDFIKQYLNKTPFKQCFTPLNIKYLLEIKQGCMSLENAIKLASDVDKETYELVHNNLDENYVKDELGITILNNVKRDLISQYLTEQLTPAPVPVKQKIYKKIYVTSDLHLFHNNIIKYENRPFSNVDNMNESLIRNWNDLVTNDDLVYILGDLSFGSMKKTNNILKRLNGDKILIKGNHDVNIDAEQFVSIHDYLEINYRGKKIVMCHYPLVLYNGDIHLYGHVHSNTGTHRLCQNIKNSYNVGVDVNNYKPVNLDEILKKYIDGNICDDYVE